MEVFFIPSVNKWFHTDDPSRVQYLALILLGANIPSNLIWKTMDGSFINMTQSLVGLIFQTMNATEQSNYANAEYHINQVRTTQNINYDYSTGWSLKYEG